MKIKFLLLTVLALLLMVSCQSESDDGLGSQSLSTIEHPVPFSMKFHDLIQQETAKLNDNALFKSENNGNGVKFVAFYSDDDWWFADFPIYDKDGNLTQWLTILFPQDGVDRALVFNETDMMVNFTSHDPRMIIWDPDSGDVLYSNFCKEDRSGLYKGRGKTGYINPEWAPKAYFWGPWAPVEGSDNYIFNIKATIYPASGKILTSWCSDSPISESVDIHYTLNGQNGKMKQTFTMR